MKDDNVRIRTAYHETGHAIAALTLGAKVKSVTVESGGLTRALYREVQPRRYHKQRSVVCLAGFAAELILNFGNTPGMRGALLDAARTGNADDFTKHRISAGQIARYTSRGPVRYSREDVSEQAVDSAMQIVLDNQRSIGRIAEHLNRLGTLPGEMVEQLHYEATVLGWE